MLLERNQHDRRHQRAVTGDANKRANHRLSRSIERGQTNDLTGGRAGETQRGKTRIATGCSKSSGRSGERHEWHDKQHAGEYRQCHISTVELGQIRRITGLLFPSSHRAGLASIKIKQTGDGMVGRGTPDKAVHSTQHGEEDGSGCGESDDCQYRGMAGTTTRTRAVEQPPKGEGVHRLPPALMS